MCTTIDMSVPEFSYADSVPLTRLTGSHHASHVDKLIAASRERQAAAAAAAVAAKKEKSAINVESRKHAKNQIYNTNKEVRTDVKIEPFTGPRSLEKYFNHDNAKSLAFLEECLDEISERYCTKCGHVGKMWPLKTPHRYKCSSCRDEFTVATNTMFADKNLPMSDTLLAIMHENLSTDGYIVEELAGTMEIARQTAFNTLTNIRKTGYTQEWWYKQFFTKPKGERLFILEVDIMVTDDGANQNRHIDKKKDGDEIYPDKSKFITFKVRGGLCLCFDITDMKEETVMNFIIDFIFPYADVIDIVMTDEGVQFQTMGFFFPGKHKAVNHSERYSVWGDVHIQNVENIHMHVQTMLCHFRKAVKKENRQEYVNRTIFQLNTGELTAYEKLKLVVKIILWQAKKELFAKLNKPMADGLELSPYNFKSTNEE